MDISTLKDAALSPDGLLGHASYALLILSMMMTRMLYLRVLAIAAGLCGILFHLFVTRDPVSATWLTLFVLTNVVQISLLSWRNRTAQFSPEDRIFREHVVPALEPVLAKRLLNTGEWRDAEPGTLLIRRGESVTHLIFIAAGEVEITVDDVEVGYCYRGHLLGEIGVLTETPATATAVAKTEVRYLALERRALLKLIDRERAVEQAIDRSFRNALRDKLATTNEALVDAETRAASKTRTRPRPSPHIS